MRRGILFVVSAPSGTGKTTVVEELVATVPDLVMSRSYTSRAPREGEVDGVDYHFVGPEVFEKMLAAGEFLESATVFGQRYGTGVGDTENYLRREQDVVLVIDIQGAEQIKQHHSEMKSIFVMPPSFDELEKRLRGRSGSSASEADLRWRLDTARREIKARDRYDYIVINDDVKQCVESLRCIVFAERSRARAMKSEVSPIADSFIHDQIKST
jgi:guanylate kinase